MNKQVIVVSGLGNGVGVGAAAARLFSREAGYSVALVSRPRDDITRLRDSINAAPGGDAEVFSVDAYDHSNITSVFQKIKAHWPGSELRTAVWNTSQWSRIPFLDIAEEDIKRSVQINVVAATAFAQEAIRWFMTNRSPGAKGTIIFTGATSAWRGAHSFGAFAAGKHGLRAISQAIAREYGPQGVHSAFVVLDGTVDTKATRRLFSDRHGENWMDDTLQVLQPESIAKAYLYLHQQDPSCWTLELDLRPAKEKF